MTERYGNGEELRPIKLSLALVVVRPGPGTLVLTLMPCNSLSWQQWQPSPGRS